MIVGLIILVLAFLGITVVSSQVEGFLRVILPVLESRASQLFAIGLLVWFRNRASKVETTISSRV
ncbi:MAG: hypothetical protein ACPL4E_03440 [Thermoproteota archaeon]